MWGLSGEQSGIIFDIDHFSVHDGPGIRTVVYLKGCPLRCLWCHSPESQNKEPQILHTPTVVLSGRNMTASEVLDEIINDKVFFETSGGGVTLSGGEVLFQAEFAEALLSLLRVQDIHTIVETSGMGSWESLSKLAVYANAIYYDIKIINNKKHRLYTGAGNERIICNLTKLAAAMPPGCIILRVPLIPGYNDAADEINEIYQLAQTLGIFQIHLLRYNVLAPAKYKWVDMPYKPGELQPRDNAYIDNLAKSAPREMEITVY